MTAPSSTAHVELPVTGMTCASCAARIERRLNKLDGVSAAVNYATARATVHFDPDTVSPGDLVAAVEAAGYGASLPPRPGQADGGDVDGDAELNGIRLRLVVSAVLTVPVVAIAMIPSLQFDRWPWLSAALEPQWCCGADGASTGRRGSTCATGRPRWTR